MQELYVSLKLHNRNATIEQMIVAEARDHTFDCSYRTSQKGDDKFKSNYLLKIEVGRLNFTAIVQFSIGIAKTNPEAKFDLPRYSYLTRAQNKIGNVFTNKFLDAFTSRNCSSIIGGNIIIAGSAFCKHFQTIISQVDKEYNVDSFADMLGFYFHEWGELKTDR